MQEAMKADGDAAIEAFVKNEQVKSVFRTMFINIAGRLLHPLRDSRRDTDPILHLQQQAGMPRAGVEEICSEAGEITFTGF